MGILDEPPRFHSLFSKPGELWTREERDAVRAWLFEPPRHQRLLGLAKYLLGDRANEQDAEDVMSNFVLRLDRLIDRFRPELGTFDVFCRVQFQYHCMTTSRKLRTQRWREPEMPDFAEPHGKSELTTRFEVESADPLETVAAEEDRRLVRKCLERLPIRDRELLVLRYFEERSAAEIAELVGAGNANYARQLVHRALQRLRQMMTSERRST
jgi:RNA polymerase sigma factor (sigma-70 family)